ncbi:GDYXXLXY domain-containing protein [Ottowia thiooxydans]|uniref:GDYXXLXY domain-containing protein n=1 Tax=Ottowia thiooxydans TaxID=219182 RepID=UPI0004001E37|nr:GDYXXLXY domain-containing protein [Ottowia thiooxydans]
MNASVSWLNKARTQGWLPPTWTPDNGHAEPSPLLAALVLLGALMCSVPLLAFLWLGIGEVILQTAAGYAVGAIGMVAALWTLRRTVHIFPICLALEILGLGTTLVLVRWMDDTNGIDGATLAASVFLTSTLMLSACLVRAPWVNRLIGFALVPSMLAVLALGLGLMGVRHELLSVLWPLGLLLVASGWVWWCWCEERWLGRPSAARFAALADGFAVGLLANALFLNAWPSLPLGFLFEGHEGYPGGWIYSLSQWCAVIVVLCSGVALIRRWSKPRGPEVTGANRSLLLLGLACAVLAAASWFSPALGIVALIAAMAAASARWRLLVACAVVALALLGHFYYSLAWPLATKGLGLVLIGAVLALGVWVLRSPMRTLSTPAVEPAKKGRIGWIVLGGLIVLGLANMDVWRKEKVIANGQRILVPLIPVDPRSLMQGDYMHLRFSIPSKMLSELNESTAAQLSKRAVGIARLDASGEAELLRVGSQNETLGEGEVKLPLRQLKGQWVLVTDAYFFAEGQGARFEQARFGEFRVLPDGRALLVGLADQDGSGIPTREVDARR